MYCNNCGTQNRDGANFCKHCGMRLHSNPSSCAEQKKTKSPWTIAAGIVAGIAAFAIAFTVFSGGTGGKSGKTPEQPALPNPAYEAVFTERGIVDTPSTFSTKHSSHFVSDDGGEVVEKLEFGYEKDLITEMVDVLYYSLEGRSETERQLIDEVLRGAFGPLNAHDFVTVRFEMQEDYYVITVKARELDEEENVKILKEAGFEMEGTLLSMKATEEALLDNGYIKR